MEGEEDKSRVGTQPARCRVCGRPLAGRTDKMFCSDRCRNIYNNGRYKEHRRKIGDFNRAVLTNYYLLKQALCANGSRILKSELLRKGFNPRCYTSSSEGLFTRWYRCLDLQYRFGRKFVHLKRDEQYL